MDHEKQEIVVKTSNKKYYKRMGFLSVLVLSGFDTRSLFGEDVTDAFCS